MSNHQSALTSLTSEPIETGNSQHHFAQELKHWRCHTDDDNIQWWCLDKADSKTNTLSQAVLSELRTLVYQFKESRETQKNTQAVVIRSLKDNGFIAGADVKEFKDLTETAEVEELLAEGREILNAIENLSVPTIALIHGFCLGGGLELALACQYHIARNDAQLGFPEVHLGLHPGLGGTVRLTRQIDPTEAMKLMLSGKSVSAKAAYKMGLVDAIGEERHFAEAVQRAAHDKLPHRGHSLKSKLLNFKPSIKLIASQAEQKTKQKVNMEHYPALSALIDLYRQYGHDSETMFEEEGKSFAKLFCGVTSKQLIRVFFLREELKEKAEFSGRHIHVVGAGAMGGDIAAWCALQGFNVTLEDLKPALLGPALQRAYELFDKKCHSKPSRQQARDRLIPDVDGLGRGRADLIIEAVPEKIDIKSKMLRELELAKQDHAILATNTSSILLQRFRENLQDGSRFVGIHFFNPVAKIPLVEIVQHDQLSDETLQQARAFTTSIDRLPVPVKSAPGFLVNRILTPYLLEALALLDEGYSKEVIDRAAEQFGMPMGPVTLTDFIGLDICVDVANMLSTELEQEFYPVPDWLHALVKQEKLGVKSGEGIYKYNKHNKPIKSKTAKEKSKEESDKPEEKDSSETVDYQYLQDRLIFPLLNTSVQSLYENIVETRDQLDAAMIFATGFAPFTGGPIQTIFHRGIKAVVEQLETFNKQCEGNRYQPSEGWKRHFPDYRHTSEKKFDAA